MSTTKHNDVLTLTVAEETELARIDADGDGTISAEEARAAAKSAAKLRANNSRLWKAFFSVIALLFLSWLGNAGLMVAVVTLSKDLKVEGGSLKNNKDDGAISTVSQKKVYEVTLPSPSRRQLDEQGSGGTNESPTVVAQATCASVMGAISSIEKGNDGSLVKLSLGDGEFWEPRMSAASYHLHENSFGIEQIYLDDQRDVSYDVTCEISKADCENAPGSLCDAVSSEVIVSDHDDRRALSFEDAFDGEAKVHSRRLKKCTDKGSHWHWGEKAWELKIKAKINHLHKKKGGCVKHNDRWGSLWPLVVGSSGGLVGAGTFALAGFAGARAAN